MHLEVLIITLFVKVKGEVMRLMNTLGLVIASVLNGQKHGFKGRGEFNIRPNKQGGYSARVDVVGPLIQIKEFSFVYKAEVKRFKSFEFSSWCTGVSVAGCIVHRLPILNGTAFDREFIVEHVSTVPTNYYVTRKMAQSQCDVDSYIWSFPDTHVAPEVLGFLLNYEPIENNPFRQQIMTALHRFNVLMNLTKL